MSEKSCLVANIGHYIETSEQDREVLATLEKEEREYPGQVDVYRSGGPARDLFVVKHGWLYSYTDLPDGRRQIVKVHHPGDIIGLSEVAYTDATTTLRSVEPAVLCPFPRSGLETIFERSPRLTAMLFTLALRDQVIFIDLIRAMGRMSARERLAHLLLTLQARIRVVVPDSPSGLRLPLTQSEIGDVVGLTNVTVSKSLVALEEEGYIVRADGHVELLREADLVELCDFTDRYSAMDTSWFPTGSAS